MSDDRAAQLLRLGRLRQEIRALEDRLALPRAVALPPLPVVVQDEIAQLITEYSADFLSVHTAVGAYVYALPNSESLFGWTAGDLLGRSAYDFFHPDDIERIAANHAGTMADQGSAPGVRYRLRCRPGHPAALDWRWVESRSRATRDGTFIVSITRDIHTQLLEEELRRDAERLLHEELHQRAYSDPVTGLPNRRSLEETLDHELERCRRGGRVIAIALFDVDRFKEANDRHGHEHGDRILRLIGSLLASLKRSYDQVGRWGGDELLLVLPEADVAGALRVAERMRAAVALLSSPEIGPLSLSGGVACSDRATDREGLLRLADAALYKAKRRGRNRVVAAIESFPEAASPAPARL